MYEFVYVYLDKINSQLSDLTNELTYPYQLRKATEDEMKGFPQYVLGQADYLLLISDKSRHNRENEIEVYIIFGPYKDTFNLLFPEF